MDEIFVVIKEKQPIISLEELSGGDCIPWIKQKGLERLTRFLVLMNNSSNIIGGGPYSQEECELLLIVYFSNEKRIQFQKLLSCALFHPGKQSGLSFHYFVDDLR